MSDENNRVADMAYGCRYFSFCEGLRMPSRPKLLADSEPLPLLHGVAGRSKPD